MEFYVYPEWMARFDIGDMVVCRRSTNSVIHAFTPFTRRVIRRACLGLRNVDDQTARLAELTSRDPDLKEAPLRRDVRSLGRLLSEVRKEQVGEQLGWPRSGQMFIAVARPLTALQRSAMCYSAATFGSAGAVFRV